MKLNIIRISIGHFRLMPESGRTKAIARYRTILKTIPTAVPRQTALLGGAAMELISASSAVIVSRMASNGSGASNSISAICT